MSDIKLSVASLQGFNKGKKRRNNYYDNFNNKRKYLRNSGIQYIGHKEKFYEDKENCSGGKECSRKCNKPGCLLEPIEKTWLCLEFWKPGIENYEKQSNILLSLIEWGVPVKRSVDIDVSRRKASYVYYLKKENGMKFRCCPTTFKATFNITQKRLQILQEKVREGCLFIEDKRGKHSNRPNKHTDEDILLIQEHISSFPTYLSHYCRLSGNPERLYLGADLNASKMFRLFLDRFGESLSYLEKLYKDTLRSSDLHFGQLKSDTCGVCDNLNLQLKNYDKNQVMQIFQTERFLELHHNKAKDGYTFLKEDIEKAKTDSKYTTLCIDMQQVLLSPRLTHGEAYYLRKFSSFNLAISAPAQNKASMYFWNENEGNRGQNDVGSCLYSYITTNYVKLNLGEERTLYLWSDRCSGQNNNYATVCLLKFLMHESYFTEVQQKFLVTGHTFLPCDRDFACIERAQKNATIHTPVDWIKIIQLANLKNPFFIKQMRYNDFLSVSDLVPYIPKPRSFKVSKYHCIKMCILEGSKLYTKMSHSDQLWESHLIHYPFNTGIPYAQRLQWEYMSIQGMHLSQAYEQKVEISQDKLEDLRKLLEYLPTEKKTVFLNIIN